MRTYNKIADLKRSYYRRVKIDTKNDMPPIMTVQQYIDVWHEEPHKLLFRNQSPQGFMMMRRDFDRPLAINNYQLIQRCLYQKYIFGYGFEQKSIRTKIAKALSAHKKTDQHRVMAGKESGKARQGKKRGPYKKKECKMEIAEAKLAGHKFYNTGRPCRRGHTSDRRTVGGSCVVCSDMYRKSLSKEYVCAANKRYHDKNVEMIKEKQRHKYHNNEEFRKKSIIRSSQWSKDNPERVKEHRLKHKEKKLKEKENGRDE